MIELHNVSKSFGDTLAVDDISFTVPKGRFCALVGTSGCGKSTTLRMINRLTAHGGGRSPSTARWWQPITRCSCAGVLAT